MSRATKWRRSARRALRGPRARWAIAGTAGVLVVVLGLLISGFLSSPAAPLGDAPSGDAGAGGLQSFAATPGASASPTRSGSNATGPTSAQEIKKQLQNKFNNPLNNLRGAGTHTVTITARSSRPMPVVGYLVPTGGTDAYGARKKTPSFVLTQRAYGKGYLAAVFIQADATGTRVTCTVTVDGKLTNTATTSGAYGRQICLG